MMFPRVVPIVVFFLALVWAPSARAVVEIPVPGADDDELAVASAIDHAGHAASPGPRASRWSAAAAAASRAGRLRGHI